MIAWKMLVLSAFLVFLFTLPVLLLAVFAALTLTFGFLYLYGGILWFIHRDERAKDRP